jgi:hypothetical protein
MAAAKTGDMKVGKSNLFADIMGNEKLAATYGFEVVHRTTLCLVLRNAENYSASKTHLIVLPLKTEIGDIKVATCKDVKVFESMFRDGLAALRTAEPTLREDDPRLISGYNSPATIPYLHLHILLAPLKPKQRLVGSNRWFPHHQLISSLIV